MINFNILKKIKRVREEDKRNFKKGIRSDRNEKVENWPSNIFQKIFSKISNHEFTAYYNTSELLSLESKIAKYYNNSCPVFNLGSDKPISIWELSKLVSKNYKLNFVYPRQNNNKFDFYVPNIDKLKKKFNFRQKFDLKKSISYTLETIKELK